LAKKLNQKTISKQNWKKLKKSLNTTVGRSSKRRIQVTMIKISWKSKKIYSRMKKQVASEASSIKEAI